MASCARPPHGREATTHAINPWGAWRLPCQPSPTLWCLLRPCCHTAVLLQFKQRFDRNGRLASWKPGTNHCKWAGVRCDVDGDVATLNLETFQLRGNLVDVDLSKLHQLRSL